MLDWAGLLESKVEQHVSLQEAVVEHWDVQARAMVVRHDVERKCI